MGAKTRSVYSTGGWCPKTDCINRDAKCHLCIKFGGTLSEYKQKKGGVKDGTSNNNKNKG